MKLLNIINKLKKIPESKPIESNIELVEIQVEKPKQEPENSKQKKPKYIERTNVFRYKIWEKENSYIYRKVIERLYLGSFKREREVYTYTSDDIKKNRKPTKC